MARLTLVEIGIAEDPSARLATRLQQAVRDAPLFAPAPVIHIATPDRRAREIKQQAAEDYLEGTPERVARELLKRFAPAVRLRSDVERDFDFFAALGRALADQHSPRRTSRALVDQLIDAAKRVAQSLPPGQRQGAWLDALGERGKLLAAVTRDYAQRLQADQCHDPEDAPWLVAELLPRWVAAGFAPVLVVVQELDRVTPARQAMLQALLANCAQCLVVLRRDDPALAFGQAASATLRQIVRDLGGSQASVTEMPVSPLAPVLQAWCREQPVAQPPQLALLRPADRVAEVREAARQIKQAAHDGVALSLMALAFPSQGPYAELVAEEFQAAGIAFDSPFETVLAEVPPVAAVLELLRVTREGLDRLAWMDALRSPYLPFGSAGVLTEIESATRKAGITGGTNAEQHWLKPLRRLDPPPGAAAMDWLVRVLQALQPFSLRTSPAVAFFDAILDLVRQAGARRVADSDASHDRADAQAAVRVIALHAFVRLLEQMRGQFQAAGNPRLTTGELVLALVEQARSRTVRRPEVAGERVKVRGLRELRGASFARLWLIGLTDNDLPLAEPESMFLPAARETALADVLGPDLAAELCRPVDAATQADYLYAGALAAAQHVTLSFPAQQGDSPLVPATPHARLLTCLGQAGLKDLPAGSNLAASPAALAINVARALCEPAGGDTAARHAVELDAALRAGLHGRGMELARGDSASPPGAFEGQVGAMAQVQARFNLQGGEARVFSPSQLDSYAECPQRFWSRYLLGLRAPEEPTLDTPANAIGTLLHATFEGFVHRLRAHVGQPAKLPRVQDRTPVNLLQAAGGDTAAAVALGHRLVQEAFDAACEQQGTRGPFWVGLKRAIAASLGGPADPQLGRGILARFIDHEIARNQQGIGVRFVEFSFGKRATGQDALDQEIALPVPGGHIRLQGSVDRVDQGPDGLFIVDYKTGQAKSSVEVRDGAAFQLPVYLAAISHVTGTQPAGMAYLRTPVEEELDEVDVTLHRGKPAYDVSDLVQNKLPARLARLVQAMGAGIFIHIPYTSPTKACQWCDFQAGCAVRHEVAAQRALRLADLDQQEVPGAYLPQAEES